MALDPHTNTRREYADRMMQSFTIPDDAARQWKHYAETLKELNGKLAFHDAMKPNIDQTYMTPAASKNKVYFMWDFVAQTLSLLGNVPTDLKGMNSTTKEVWSDVQSRSAMAKSLILDTNAGMLDMMVSSTYPNQTGQPPAFGQEIMTIARRL